jgi:plasmid stabilization system protein ParE
MRAIVLYLRERNPIAAVRFVESAQATFEHLAETPRAYSKVNSTNPRLAELRSRPLTGAFSRYQVYYSIASDDLPTIVRVLHSARDIDRAFG